MLKYSCPRCGAVYFGPGRHPEETDRCGYCQSPIRAIYLTDEEYEIEEDRVLNGGLPEHQARRTHVALWDPHQVLIPELGVRQVPYPPRPLTD